MQVKHCKTITKSQNTVARTQAIACSPNSKVLAVADHTRCINLYDESGERRDKIPTRAADGKSKSYVVTGLAFSPDSSCIAVAQSDCIVMIYRIGLEWGSKKSICNKFPQNSPVTCVAWPTATAQGVELIVFGTQEGKVKVGILKAKKSQSLYTHEHPCVSISQAGNKVISGHIDGTVYVYVFESEDGSETAGCKRLFVHSCSPTVLSWGESICAAGSDGMVTFYSHRGQKQQTFEYNLKTEGELTAGAFNPSGQAMVVAGKNQLRMFDFNLHSKKWEEGEVIPLVNSYTVPQLAWRQDGSRLITGSFAGAVDLFDACLKRYRLRGAFEFTYVSHNQVIVKRLATGTRIVLRSYMGYEIQRVNVHQDRYLVAHTSTTLLVGDLISCKLSEVTWQLTGKETYVFDNPNVCMIFTAGELCLIEYGKNTLLGTCRTEEHNAHRISVRVHDPDPESEAKDTPRRVIAYLIDRETIQVDDLVSGVSVARIAHTVKVDWLELNYQASKLLFRDKQHQLFLYDMVTQQRTTLLNYCTYVQWVPGSDVVVAQNRVELCVWYSISTPDRVAVVPIKGEVEGIERGNGKTEVIVDEGVNTVAYGLDESMIEFGTAMEEKNYNRACDLLDRVPLASETEGMWGTLAEVALQELKLKIAERCFAALGDIAKVTALQRINALAAKASKESKGATDGYDHYTVQAELYMLNKDFKRAEQIYLEHGKVEDAIAMWEEMNRFKESVAIAEERNLDDVATRRARYFSWLMETGQYEKAGEIKEKEGKHIDAINLYLRGGTPARAANVVNANDLKPEQQLLEAIAAALFKAQVFEKAGDFFEKLRMGDRAIAAYKRGHIFSKAVEYAKANQPDLVPKLEEEWGNYLCSQKHVDQAINHFAEAGQPYKAVKAAINSRQWTKAADILESQNVGVKEDGTLDPKVAGCYTTIARHYEEIHQYPDAEKYFIKGGAVNDAVDMYSRAGMADHMYRVAQRHLDQAKLVELFLSQAKQLETKGDYAGAERIYLKVNEPDQSIVMYKRARDFTNMIRLVQAYRPDYLLKTHLSLGAQFEKEGNLKTAETHYVAGKDWGRAVNMYREKDMWDDAVRVAKVHGGANAAKQVVLSRAMVLDAEEGVQLLIKFNLVEAGIDAALEAYKFDLAQQWAQVAQPAKLPYVALKNAMHYEDQGDFRMAEEAFLKSGKPREAIDMYVHQHEFSSAMRVAENYDPSAIPGVCAANGRVCFQQGNYKEADALFLRANAPEALLKLYLDARMFVEAQRITKEYCPEMQGEVAKRIALQSNDPQKAGVVLEENGEYQLAIDTYLGATPETVPDMNTLANLWVRAVRVAQKHQRNSLKEVMQSATAKLKEHQRYVEAGKCLEDCEDYKGAITLYVQGKKFDMAESLAKRISPELEDYVRRAIVQDSIEGGHMRDAKVVEEMDPEAALKTYIANNDFPNALRMAKQKSAEEYHYTAGLEMQYHLKQGSIPDALQVLEREELDPDDFRFYGSWLEFAQKLCVSYLPSDDLDLTRFHRYIVHVAESIANSGQQADDIARGRALSHAIHAYHVAKKMREWQLPDLALKLLLGLPRWIPFLPADKAFYDAGVAAKQAGKTDIAFLYLNRALDIVERIDDGDGDSSNIENTDFDCTDFPKVYRLPKQQTVPAEKMEEINSWVLTESIEKTGAAAERKLPLTKDPQSSEEMFEGALTCPGSGNTFPECCVTGYPVLGKDGVAKCSGCQRPANQGDWTKLLFASKQCPWCEKTESPDFKI